MVGVGHAVVTFIYIAVLQFCIIIACVITPSLNTSTLHVHVINTGITYGSMAQRVSVA